MASASQSIEWTPITPSVHSEAEFLEIANDFGNPLEIVREAISNAIDAQATWLKIGFWVESIEGSQSLVIQFLDNGTGMTEGILSTDFWGLGFSQSRHDPTKIGEKGHGTKIFLRSEKVIVRTQTADEAFESECDRPMRALSQGKAHEPRIRAIPRFQDHTGTDIKVIRYNQNQRSRFVQEEVKDYIYWFTKFGSVEWLFDHDKLKDFRLYLKCLDKTQYEELAFGHPFPQPNCEIENLFNEHGAAAANLYVKRFLWKQERLEKSPEVTFDMVLSVEGDTAKRAYNPQLRDRRRQGGQYRVLDRYGLWLCKDHIPVQRVNDWISGFGSGSNAFTLLHGFVNCQHLKLTANRGSIANTEPEILEELKKAASKFVQEVDAELGKNGIYTLFDWQSEERTLAQEKTDFNVRCKSIARRRVATHKGHTFLEPRNESELFGLFMRVYALEEQLFAFEPLDYNTTRGIDIIARNKSGKTGAESDLWYVELKYLLKTNLNHSFKHLRWLLCWDFDKGIDQDSEFGSTVQENDIRKLQTATADGNTLYFLNSPTSAVRVQVIRLQEFLRQHLGMEFKLPN
jgi:histidine kinase/DNA gyrase B/HSP90-like ATPase